jgi:cyclic lactone autoinducer peptide
MTKIKERGETKDESKNGKKLAKGIAKVLETTLKVEANSTSCFVMYQPKVPKELSKYRRMK